MGACDCMRIFADKTRDRNIENDKERERTSVEGAPEQKGRGTEYKNDGIKI